jgi:hypothetical protein
LQGCAKKYPSRNEAIDQTKGRKENAVTKTPIAPPSFKQVKKGYDNTKHLI